MYAMIVAKYMQRALSVVTSAVVQPQTYMVQV